MRTLQAFEGEEGNREKIGKPERGRRKKVREGQKKEEPFFLMSKHKQSLSEGKVTYNRGMISSVN